jgi:hypothetical protein
VLFTVSFDVIGQVGSVSAVALAGAPTTQGVSMDAARVAFGAEDGNVSVVGPGVLVSNAGCANGVFRLSVPTETGHSYILEFSDTLAPANWTALTSTEKAGANEQLAHGVDVELVFKRQITQDQIDGFTARGGKITYEAGRDPSQTLPARPGKAT